MHICDDINPLNSKFHTRFQAIPFDLKMRNQYLSIPFCFSYRAGNGVYVYRTMFARYVIFSTRFIAFLFRGYSLLHEYGVVAVVFVVIDDGVARLPVLKQTI